MERKFFLMVYEVDEKYIDPFFERFGEDLENEKGIVTKLRNYEKVCGGYIISLGSRNFGSKRKKIIKTSKFEKELEKCSVEISLPDNLQEFLRLCEKKTTPIEAGEGRDAIVGKISIRERKGEKEYYLSGEILNRMRGALAEEIPLEKVLKY